MDFLPDNLLVYVEIAVAVIAAASVFAAAIAKLTKNTTDDKIAAFLGKVHDLIAKLGFHPPLAEKQAGKAVVQAGAQVVAGAKVYDHRAK